jgi:uncharacterized repeat protein (TIGR04138 family)
MNAAERFQLLIRKDARYDPEAYNFIYEALDHTLKTVITPKSRSNQHVTGPELLEGVRQFAIEQFGCLAKMVLENWSIKSTGDVGEVVFNLVEYDLMGKQDSDSKLDFIDVYSFDDAFDVKPVFSYRQDRDEWGTNYIADASS